MLLSAFRDGAHYVDRYFAQVDALRAHLPVTCYLVEGDSADGTAGALIDRLTDRDASATLIHVNHGGPKFTSVDHPQRWNQIAQVWNTLLDKLPQAGDAILVEADLCWEPDTMLALLADLAAGCDAVAPQSVKDGRFYDTWGHRWSEDQRFSDEPLPEDAGLQPIFSAGSCIAMRQEVYRDCRFGENDGIVGFGRDLHFKDYSMFVDPAVSVVHP